MLNGIHFIIVIVTVINLTAALVFCSHGFIDQHKKTKRLGLFLCAFIPGYIILLSQFNIPDVTKLGISLVGFLAAAWVFILDPLLWKLVRWNKKRKENKEKEKLLREIAFWEGSSYDEAGCLSGKTINGLKAHLEKLRKD